MPGLVLVVYLVNIHLITRPHRPELCARVALSSDCASQNASGHGRRRSTAASLLYLPAVLVWVSQDRGSPPRRSSHPDSSLRGLPGTPGLLRMR
jgi:hypothetical protein